MKNFLLAVSALSAVALTRAGCSSSSTAGPPPTTTPLVPKFAYVVNNGGNNVSAYTITLSSGALTPVNPFGVAVARMQ